MIYGRIACVLLLFLWSAPSRSTEYALDLAAKSIAAVQEQLTTGQIVRVDVRRVSDLQETRIPISPEDFNVSAEGKSTLQLSKHDARQLAAALRKLNPTQASHRPDLRWQVFSSMRAETRFTPFLSIDRIFLRQGGGVTLTESCVILAPLCYIGSQVVFPICDVLTLKPFD